MKKLSILACILLLTIQNLEAQTAKEVIEQMDQQMHGETSYTEMKMTIIRPGWQRTMTMKSWSKGEDYNLILVTGPARDKGIAYLKRGREMWNWQPSIDRVVKMPPSMMTQSWMGSDFTNDDLVRQASIVEDYTHKMLGSASIEGKSCYKIELRPKEESAVVWGKIIMWVTKENHLQLKVEFYDEDDYLVNSMLGKNIQSLGGRLMPTKLEVIPADEEDHKTVIEYLDAKFNQSIPNQTFSIQYMKRVR